VVVIAMQIYVIVIPRARVLCLIYIYIYAWARGQVRIYRQNTSAHGITNMFRFSLQAHLSDKFFSCYNPLLYREPNKLWLWDSILIHQTAIWLCFCWNSNLQREVLIMFLHLQNLNTNYCWYITIESHNCSLLSKI